jgi:hypothetical protein
VATCCSALVEDVGSLSQAGPNNALEPTPTASARSSLPLLARLTADAQHFTFLSNALMA